MRRRRSISRKNQTIRKNMKLKEKLLLDFQSVTDFEQLRREIEVNYLGKRVTSHLQLEFNALKRNPHIWKAYGYPSHEATNC